MGWAPKYLAMSLHCQSLRGEDWETIPKTRVNESCVALTMHKYDWPILEVLTKTLSNLIIYEFYDTIILILEQGEDVISSTLKLSYWDVTLFTI